MAYACIYAYVGTFDVLYSLSLRAPPAVLPFLKPQFSSSVGCSDPCKANHRFCHVSHGAKAGAVILYMVTCTMLTG